MTRASDLEDGGVGLLLALEGMAYVGSDLWVVDLLASLGVRMASLTHWGRNELADGTVDEGANGRLSVAGARVVRRLAERRVLLDVSHLAPACIDHALELTGGPVVASHSGARAVLDHHRNLSDRHLRAIAETGGVACAILFAPFVDREQPSVDRVVDHLAHMLEVAGVEHVGVGSDFIGDWVDELYPSYGRFVLFDDADLKARIPGLERTADLPVLREALERRGFSDHEASAVLGGNLLRLLRDRL